MKKSVIIISILGLAILLAYTAFRSILWNDIRTLKKAGFFQDFEKKSSLGLTIYFLKRRKQYLGNFSYFINPDRKELASCDSTKYIDIYPEVLVYEDIKFYANLVHRFDLISDSQFNPSSIKEEWITKIGPLELSYVDSQGSLIILDRISNLKWLDYKIVSHLRMQLEDRDIVLKELKQSDGALLRITPSEQSVLEEGFGWRFK